MSSIGATSESLRYHESPHEIITNRQKTESSELREEKTIELLQSRPNFVEQHEDEIFNVRFIELVKNRPCMFDERNENFNNEFYKNEVWMKIQSELRYEGSTPINIKWKNLLRYYTDIRRNNDQIPRDALISPRVIEEMKFFDNFIFSNDVDGQGQSISQDLMISGYKPVPRRSQQEDPDEISHSGPGYVVIQPSLTNPGQPIVVSQPRQSRHLVLQQPQKRYSIQSQSNGRFVKQSPETAQMDDQRKSTKTMYIDTSMVYQKDGKKLFRLYDAPSTSAETKYLAEPDQLYVNGDQIAPPPRKRANTTPHRMQGEQITHQIIRQPIGSQVLDERSIMAGVDLTNGEIIDDGIQENTIVIESDALQEHSPLLGESPEVGSMMISGQSMSSHRQQSSQQQPQSQSTASSNQQQSQPQSQQQQQQGTVHMTMHPSTSVMSASMPRSPTLEAMIPPDQMQYDADLEFQQLISSHLSRMSEEDKTLMKFNIQRILLDARFGPRTAYRILQEEESEEMAASMGQMVDGDGEP